MRYIVDTNLWIEVSRKKLTCADLKGKSGVNVALAPPVIIELVRGVVRGGGQYFSRDKSLFQCMSNPGFEILELPRVFVSTILWNLPGGRSGVRPEHYRELMDFLVRARTFTDFLAETEKSGSVWKKMDELDSIHENVLEKELKSLEKLAGASLRALPVNLCRLYKCGGLLPDPEVFTDRFSAAMEFLKSSIIQVRNGANPYKNDRGLYVDQQLFFYLADPDVVVVTKEDFSNKIKISPQLSRIMSYEAFRRL